MNKDKSWRLFIETGDRDHWRDHVNIVTRGPFDHIIAELKEKVRATTRTIIEIFKEIITKMYDKNQMQFYPDDEPMPFIVAYDYDGNPIYSDDDYQYIDFQGDLVKYEDSHSDHFLLAIGGKLKEVSDLYEII